MHGRERDSRADDRGSESSSGSALAGSLTAAAPDVTAADEHRRRRDLVRQRLLGDGPMAVRIGRFALLGLVGSGATSVVYAAYDEELDRRVAVKLLRTPLALADERLRREAQAMARLAHPNVVAVHEIGDWEGRLFITMELVKGQTLDAWLGERPRPWKEIVEVFLQAGRGLAAAHDLGLVHRDFKPANVMVGEDGRARVLDFGLVRLAEQTGAPEEPSDDPVPIEAPPQGSGSLTATGACVGTPAYMAPEQRAAVAADARSDQFSFCVALHEAIFGVRPGAAPARDGARREGLVPARLSRVIDRGLAADPGARWPAMGHLLGELERLRWPARRWRLYAAVLGMAALVAAVALAARHRVIGEERARAALEQQAAHQRVLAHDARLVVAAQRLIERDPTAAAAALREVRDPDKASGWRSTATAVLLEPLSSATRRVIDTEVLVSAMFNRDGSHVLSSLLHGNFMVWRADGSGTPVMLRAEPSSSAALSADGDWALTWNVDDAKVVISRTDGSVQRTVRVPDKRVAGAAFTGTGTDVVTVSTEGVVRLWQSAGARTLEALAMPPGPPGIRDPSRWSFKMGPAGRHVLGLAPDGAPWLWRTRGPRPAVPLISSQRHQIHRTRFSADERWLVVMFQGGDLQLWDTEAGGPPRMFRGHEKTVFDFDLSPDGRRLATASYDGTARVWPMDGSGEPMVLRGHAAKVDSVRFAPEGRRVVTASQDRTARVWSLDGSGDVMVLRGHAHHVIAAAFSPDGRTVVTCGREQSVRVWDVSRRPVRILGKHDAKIWSATLDPGGRRLVTAGLDGTARIWHLDDARPPIVLRGHEAPQVYTAVFSPDGRRVATGAADGTARIWSADAAGAPRVLKGHDGWVYGLAFSPDGRWLATGSKTGEVRLSPVDAPGTASVLERRCGARIGSRIHTLIFGPRGDRIVADAPGCEGKAALLWVGGDRRRVALGSAEYSRIQLAMSSEGRIATGHKDGSLLVWGPDGDGPLAILRGHDAELHDLAFSRDGRRLLSASYDGSARIWDLEHPRDPIILRGHEDWVNKAAFDASEHRIVTASADNTARVWRLDEPDQPIVLRGHEDDVRYAGFTPAGRVVTASFDGTVRLWSLDEGAADPRALMEQLRRATSVCLTADQRMRYLEEPAAVAAARFTACERAAGRAP